jgi:hypothetical protein
MIEVLYVIQERMLKTNVGILTTNSAVYQIWRRTTHNLSKLAASVSVIEYHDLEQISHVYV